MTDGLGLLATARHHTAALAGRPRLPALDPAGDRAPEMRAHEPTGPQPSGTVEALLRSLLAAEGRADADLRVVEGVRSLFDAGWVALVDPAEGQWVCRCAVGRDRRMGEVWDEPDKSIGETAATRLTTRETGETAVLSADLQLTGGATRLLVGAPDDRAGYASGADELLERLAPDLALTLRKAEELDTLRSQAFVDALTGCYNRRGFDEQLGAELRRVERYERTAALMLVDLDGFKRINDELGHQAGDHVLRIFAGLLSGTFRNSDVVSRYGGDEFAVIFPETTTAEAERLAERVRGLLAGAFPDEVIARPVRASFGVASFPVDAESAEGLIAAADRALYAAKSGGRDRVVASRPRKDSPS